MVLSVWNELRKASLVGRADKGGIILHRSFPITLMLTQALQKWLNEIRIPLDLVGQYIQAINGSQILLHKAREALETFDSEVGQADEGNSE